MRNFVRRFFRRKPREWNSLLAEFRSLGGTAENIMLGRGSRGRGVFSLDPAKPVRLYVPPNLLVKIEDTEIRGGQLVIKSSAAIDLRERAFFESYQRNFSWGAGVLADLWQIQLARSRLPRHIQKALPVNGSYFREPSETLCHQLYGRTRSMLHRGATFVIPVLELVNHDGAAAGFDSQVGVSGTFDGEVLVKYGSNDCWGMAMNHGFCNPRNHAYALSGSFKFEDYRVVISRDVKLVKHVNGGMMPIVRVENDTVRFPILMLGNVKTPQLPRSIFLHVTKNTPVKQPDALFDQIQHYNRLIFFKFLEASEGNTTPLVSTLRSAAYEQLKTLSSHLGAAPLAADPANT